MSVLYVGKDPHSGSPAVSVMTCDGTTAQQFVNDTRTLQLRNVGNGQCLDITGHATNDGASVETYSCDPTPLPNQVWRWDSVSQAIVSAQQTNFLLTVCPAKTFSSKSSSYGHGLQLL